MLCLSDRRPGASRPNPGHRGAEEIQKGKEEGKGNGKGKGKGKGNGKGKNMGKGMGS